ncbi:DUF3392 domain-containing protein [Shewanella sp. VB17]|uniref:DUF3392 domain-containing protein n=1 Tax=Shewanella sp. VB17 TaxID=2739432 RepID=UPI001566F2C7|nr:DUF3392 domain-containing protein [Shewanella sp. VB17]NRD75377.1 DUF3392 domain-containing protein [Shewanella sp. VB17]
MQQIISIFHQVGSLLYPWLSEISTAIIACFLVAFGTDINRFLRHQLQGRSFILRTVAFVMVNAFGYGMLIVTVSPVLANNMAKLSAPWLLWTVILSFLFIGSWAQKNRQV